MTKKFLFLTIGLFYFATTAISQKTVVPDERGFIVKLGDLAPDFDIIFSDGKPSMKLSALKGKVVLLQFTASWCGVCVKEMPHIEKEIWNKFKNKGLHVFGIDRKENKEKVLKFAKKTKVTYPLLMDEEGEIFELFAAQNAGVTRNILVDKDGKIVFMTRLFVKQEFNQLIQKIEEIL